MSLLPPFHRFHVARFLKEGYPTGAFTIVEFFNTRYKTTGVTYQADNDPLEHTTLTAAVDISINPIIGQNGRIDIGVLPYDGSAGSLQDVWIALRANIRAVLERVTLADLATGKLPKSVAALAREPAAWTSG